VVVDRGLGFVGRDFGEVEFRHKVKQSPSTRPFEKAGQAIPRLIITPTGLKLSDGNAIGKSRINQTKDSPGGSGWSAYQMATGRLGSHDVAGRVSMKLVLCIAMTVLIQTCPLAATAAGGGSDGELEKGATMLETMKGLSRRSLEMWQSGTKVDPLSIFAEGYMNHQEPAADGGIRVLDLAGWRAIVRGNHEAFPDLKAEILMQIAEGDTIATHWRFSATQTGAYEGLIATGKQVRWTGVQIDRFEDGRIAESWVSWDKYTQFSELGLIK
jgi:predicted ester cyclase